MRKQGTGTSGTGVFCLFCSSESVPQILEREMRGMMNMKRILFAGLVASLFLVGNVGCTEKPPAKNEVIVTTPRGTTITVERPVTTEVVTPHGTAVTTPRGTTVTTPRKTTVTIEKPVKTIDRNPPVNP
jgi:hypothetical protein